MRKIAFSFLLALASASAGAQNPYLPLWEHLPDGEPRVFEDPDAPGKYRAYIIGSHDISYDRYCGNDIRMWSAPVEDLSQWRAEGPIFSWFVNGQWDTMYAPDLVEVNDRTTGKKTYWLYPHSRGWRRVAMVCKSDRPDGPFTPVNLTPDGIVGQGTWYKLVSLYGAVSRLSELVSEGQPFTQVQGPSAGVTLREGSTGLAVSALQYFISIIAQFNSGVPPLAIDGIFGPRTRDAVEAAQTRLGLPAIGVVDQQTWQRLYDEYLGIARTALAGANLPTSARDIESSVAAGQFPGYNLTFGNSNA